MPPECLDIEISKSMAMANVERSAARMRELSAMGIHISIDDFGTGYSSLNYLKRLPIMNLRVVAEGVEKESQLSFLREQQCDEAQGFLFSEPLPAEKFRELAKTGK